MSGNGWPKQVSHKHHNKHTTHPTVTKSSMQSHKRATPQPSPTHQPLITPSGGNQEDRGGTRPACHNKVKHQQPWSFAITHTHSQCNHQASQSKRHLVLVFVARLMSLTHTPQGRGEPWLMTRGVHHGSSHTHTSGQHTSHSPTRSGACHGVHKPCHSHTHQRKRTMD